MTKLRLWLWFWSRCCTITGTIIAMVFNICRGHFSQNLYFFGMPRSRLRNWRCRYQWWSFELFFGIYESKIYLSITVNVFDSIFGMSFKFWVIFCQKWFEMIWFFDQKRWFCVKNQWKLLSNDFTKQMCRSKMMILECFSHPKLFKMTFQWFLTKNDLEITFFRIVCLILTYMLWSVERWFSWFCDFCDVADWINGLK